MNGSLPMGSKLSESILAQQLDSTIAPVRAAIKMLEQENLVDVKPRSGTYVFQFNEKEMRQIIEYRIYLESDSLRISGTVNKNALVQKLSLILDKMKIAVSRGNLDACASYDSEFHRAIFEMTQNQFFIEGYAMIASRLEAIVNTLRYSNTMMKIAIEHYTQIISFIKSDEVDSAVELLKEHLEPGFQLKPSLNPQ